MLIANADIMGGLDDRYLHILLALGLLGALAFVCAAGVAHAMKATRYTPLSILLCGYWCSGTSFVAAGVRGYTFETRPSWGPFIVAAATALIVVLLRAHLRYFGPRRVNR